MTFEINSKKSNSGKRTVYYPTIMGHRLSNINFARKWEARRLALNVIEKLGEEKIMEIISKKSA